MSVADLEDYVWSNLPPLRWVAGRQLVARLTRRCARRFPGGVMSDASPEGRDMVLDEIRKAVERTERANYRMGFLLSLVLSALLGEIVRALFAWWLKSASNRTVLLGWQAENVL